MFKGGFVTAPFALCWHYGSKLARLVAYVNHKLTSGSARISFLCSLITPLCGGVLYNGPSTTQDAVAVMALKKWSLRNKHNQRLVHMCIVKGTLRLYVFIVHNRCCELRNVPSS
jgi:hypothetical protein